MVSVIARLVIQEGCVAQAIEAARELMVGVAREDGTLYYTLNRDTKNPNALVVVERYRDMGAFEAHSTTPHIRKFFEQILPKLAQEPEITIMDELISI